MPTWWVPCGRCSPPNDIILVAPTDPTPVAAPAQPGDTVVSILGGLELRTRRVNGNLRLADGGGSDFLVVSGRSSSGLGAGEPEVANGNDTITVTGNGVGGGAAGDTTIAITNQSQGALQGVTLANDSFDAFLGIAAGNESAPGGDSVSVAPNADRAIIVVGGSPTLFAGTSCCWHVCRQFRAALPQSPSTTPMVSEAVSKVVFAARLAAKLLAWWHGTGVSIR